MSFPTKLLGQRRRVLRRASAPGLALLAGLIGAVLAGFAQAPSWWTNRTVIVINGIQRNYAPINQGQLKWLAMQAAVEFSSNSLFSGEIGNLVASLSSTNNYRPVNLGQLKNVAQPFYDCLWANGLTNCYPQGAGWPYPWSGSSKPTNDYALANIGQAKYLFSFDLAQRTTNSIADSDGDGLPNSWEQKYFGDVTLANPYADPDMDGLNNLQEFLLGTDPTNANTYGVGLPDGLAAAHRLGANSQMLAWWPLDGGSTVPCVSDISTNQLNGTLIGGGAGSWVSGMFSNALALSGVDDYVEIADRACLNPSSLTVSLWFKSDAGSGSRVTICTTNIVVDLLSEGVVVSDTNNVYGQLYEFAYTNTLVTNYTPAATQATTNVVDEGFLGDDNILYPITYVDFVVDTMDEYLENISSTNYVTSSYTSDLIYTSQVEVTTYAIIPANSFTNIITQSWRRPTPLLSKYDPAVAAGYEVIQEAEALVFRLGVGGERVLRYGGVQVDDLWHHFVGTYDGTLQELYLDGALVANTNYAGVTSVSATAAPLRLGKSAADESAACYAGTLDEVQLYGNRVDSNTIVKVYQRLIGSDGDWMNDVTAYIHQNPDLFLVTTPVTPPLSPQKDPIDLGIDPGSNWIEGRGRAASRVKDGFLNFLGTVTNVFYLNASWGGSRAGNDQGNDTSDSGTWTGSGEFDPELCVFNESAKSTLQYNQNSLWDRTVVTTFTNHSDILSDVSCRTFSSRDPQCFTNTDYNNFRNSVEGMRTGGAIWWDGLAPYWLDWVGDGRTVVTLLDSEVWTYHPQEEDESDEGSTTLQLSNQYTTEALCAKAVAHLSGPFPAWSNLITTATDNTDSTNSFISGISSLRAYDPRSNDCSSVLLRTARYRIGVYNPAYGESYKLNVVHYFRPADGSSGQVLAHTALAGTCMSTSHPFYLDVVSGDTELPVPGAEGTIEPISVGVDLQSPADERTERTGGG